MKTLLSILCLPIAALWVSGCVSSSEVVKSHVSIISPEYAGKEVVLSISRGLPANPNETHKSQFDSLGYANVEFIHLDTLQASLIVGDYEFFTTLYIEPGSGIELTIKNGVPTFKGDLEVMNAYFYQINENSKEGQKFANENYSKYKSASALEQQVYLDSLTTFGTELKKQIESDNAISNYYRQLLLDHFNLFKIGQRLHFDTNVGLNKINTTGRTVELDSTLANAFEGFKLDRKYITNTSYLGYLDMRLFPIKHNLMNYYYENNVKIGEYEFVKKAIDKNFDLDDYREVVMAVFLSKLLRGNDIEYELGSKLVDSFRRDYPKSKYIRDLAYFVDELYPLKSGMPMKDIEMLDVSGKPFKASTLLGNLIYIDIWATWCGPCVEELEYSKKLSKKYADRPDLKFLYVSTDQDTEKWKRFLRKNPQLKGLHGIQNADFVADSSMVTSLYRISGIPRYILIDKKGNIVTIDAKRPSELLSLNYLDSLLAL
jgi:thiol-disulfide isomerase/thioredoxin